jgi:hypothetical protein
MDDRTDAVTGRYVGEARVSRRAPAALSQKLAQAITQTAYGKQVSYMKAREEAAILARIVVFHDFACASSGE